MIFQGFRGNFERGELNPMPVFEHETGGGSVSGLPSPFASGGPNWPSALAGPESAAEHLRNAEQLLNELQDRRLWNAMPDPTTYMVKTAEIVEARELIVAVRRRVAAALALLEGRA